MGAHGETPVQIRTLLETREHRRGPERYARRAFSFCQRVLKSPTNTVERNGEPNMRMSISRDARPQAMTLLIATAISVVLWFIPFAEVLTYPFRIFVTFIHEGGHAIAALLTGNSVESLSVAMNASGETYTTQGGLFSQVFISSAGYIGSMIFGALLLVLIRKTVAARIVLLSCAIYIFGLTMIFGLIKPIFWIQAWSGIPF